MKKLSRILVVTPFFYPHWGGSERYVFEIYTAMLKKHHGIKVDVLTYDTNNTGVLVQQYGKLTVYRVPAWNILPGQFVLPDYLQLIKRLRLLKTKYIYDIVNSQTRFFDNSWWVPLCARYLGAKSILTDHCADHPNHNSMFVRFVARLVDHIFIPLSQKIYDQVMATSRATRTFLLRHGLKNAWVVPNGISINDNSTRRRVQKNIQVAFVGRMIETKGCRLALSVADKLVSKYSNVNFIFAGDGPLLPELRELIQNKKIQFKGKMSSGEITTLLNKTDILLYPSTHHDGLPSVLLEAGQAGCSVIATKVGGVPDIIENMKTGMLVEPNTAAIKRAIVSLINDGASRRKLGDNLKAKIRANYDWNMIAENYYRLMIGLL